MVTEDDEDLVDRLEEARDQLTGLDWKVHDPVVVPVREIHVPDPAEAEK